MGAPLLLKRRVTVLAAIAALGSAAVITAEPALADPDVTGTYNALPVSRIASPAAALAPGGTMTFNAKVGLALDTPATAFDLTLTAIAPTRNGYLTAYSGATRPGVATVTFTGGESTPNETALRVDATGVVTVYNGSPGTVRFAVDRSGYWTGGEGPSDTGGAFDPVTPVRVADSRPKAMPLAPRSGRNVSVGDLPDNASAVVVNLGVVSPTASGYLSATGDADADSRTNVISFSTGRTRSGLAFVPVNDDGTISLFNGAPNAVNFTVDLFGVVTDGDASAGGSLAVVSSYRAADSRLAAGPIATKSVRRVQLLPEGSGNDVVGAAILNVTATRATSSGYLEAWNGSSPRPTTSVTNFSAGNTRTGTAIVPIAADGSISLYNAAPTAVSYVVDVEGLVVAEPQQGEPTVTNRRIASLVKQAHAVANHNLGR